MRLWGNNDEAETDAPAPARKPSGFEGMVLQFIANNPELKATIESFTTGLQQFAVNQAAILQRQDAINSKLDTLIQLAARGVKSDMALGGNGVISDGVRCPTCGTTGECECYPDGSGGDGSRSGDGSGGGRASGSVSG